MVECGSPSRKYLRLLSFIHVVSFSLGKSCSTACISQLAIAHVPVIDALFILTTSSGDAPMALLIRSPVVPMKTLSTSSIGIPSRL